MVNEIKTEKLKLLIENVYESDYRDLQMLMEKINSPGVRICLDTGHLLCSSKQGIELWIENLKPYIEYVHLHWNIGKNDDHLIPPNKFLLELKELLERNNINPVIALEYEINDGVKEIERVRTHFR